MLIEGIFVWTASLNAVYYTTHRKRCTALYNVIIVLLRKQLIATRDKERTISCTNEQHITYSE